MHTYIRTYKVVSKHYQSQSPGKNKVYRTNSLMTFWDGLY